MLNDDLAGIADPVLREKFAEFIGRDPHPSAGTNPILKFSDPRSGKRFEWHPQARKVYLIKEQADGKVVGQIVAFNIETHGDAKNAVLIFMRGFDEGRQPETVKQNLAEGA